MMAQEEPPMPEDSPITPTEVPRDEAGLPTVEGAAGDAGVFSEMEGAEAGIPGTNAGSGKRPYPVG